MTVGYLSGVCILKRSAEFHSLLEVLLKLLAQIHCMHTSLNVLIYVRSCFNMHVFHPDCVRSVRQSLSWRRTLSQLHPNTAMLRTHWTLCVRACCAAVTPSGYQPSSWEAEAFTRTHRHLIHYLLICHKHTCNHTFQKTILQLVVPDSKENVTMISVLRVEPWND